MRCLVLFLALAGAGCGYTELAPVPDDVGPSHVWIVRGGKCVRTGAPGVYTPVDLRAELGAAGVEVVRFEKEGGPLCVFGGRPSPPALFYALIPRSQLDAAERLGFRREYGFERGLPPPDAGG